MARRPEDLGALRRLRAADPQDPLLSKIERVALERVGEQDLLPAIICPLPWISSHREYEAELWSAFNDPSFGDGPIDIEGWSISRTATFRTLESLRAAEMVYMRADGRLSSATDHFDQVESILDYVHRRIEQSLGIPRVIQPVAFTVPDPS